MSNRRFILVFLVGSLLLAAFSWWLSCRTENLVADEDRVVLPFGPDEADRVEIVREDGTTNLLTRLDSGRWQIERPFRDGVDAVVLAKLLDQLLFVRPGDRLTAADLRQLGRETRDFGLAEPHVLVTIGAGPRRVSFAFGDETPSRKEVYVKLGNSPCVFVVPVAALKAVPANVDGLRRRQVFDLTPAQVMAVDFRAPGGSFVKIARTATGWQMLEPTPSPADAAVVNAAVARLLDMKIERFVWPDTRHPAADVDLETGTLRATALAPYGLAEADDCSATFWTSSGASQRIVFGHAAGERSVHALVHDGTSVVTVPADGVAVCRGARKTFADTRLYPYGDADIASFSVTSANVAYLLARDTNGVWRLESPAVAPADSAVAAALLTRVLSLKEEDRAPAGATSLSVAVSLKSAATNLPPASVAAKGFPDLVNLRSKQIMDFDEVSVTRLTVKAGRVGGVGSETVVLRASAAAPWQLEKTESAADVRRAPRDSAVNRLLHAFAHATASSVENINPAHEDFVKCGLAPAAFTLTADLNSADAVRRNFMLGNAAPGGGRYATAGGVDAIFIVSRELVADLTVPLAENVLEKSTGKAAEQK